MSTLGGTGVDSEVGLLLTEGIVLPGVVGDGVGLSDGVGASDGGSVL